MVLKFEVWCWCWLCVCGVCDLSELLIIDIILITGAYGLKIDDEQ